jgi:hypothetical protein
MTKVLAVNVMKTTFEQQFTLGYGGLSTTYA